MEPTSDQHMEMFNRRQQINATNDVSKNLARIKNKIQRVVLDRQGRDDGSIGLSFMFRLAVRLAGARRNFALKRISGAEI